MGELPVEIPREEIAAFCTHNHIQKLSLSARPTPRFQEDSDIDFLVEFEPGRGPGMLGLVRMERELSAMLGRKVDLRTPRDLSRHFRDEVVASAVPQYELH